LQTLQPRADAKQAARQCSGALAGASSRNEQPKIERENSQNFVVGGGSGGVVIVAVCRSTLRSVGRKQVNQRHTCQPN
jgi:hypothetical protein